MNRIRKLIWMTSFYSRLALIGLYLHIKTDATFARKVRILCTVAYCLAGFGSGYLAMALLRHWS